VAITQTWKGLGVTHDPGYLVHSFSPFPFVTPTCHLRPPPDTGGGEYHRDKVDGGAAAVPRYGSFAQINVVVVVWCVRMPCRI
jgi:hypothetical protein